MSCCCLLDPRAREGPNAGSEFSLNQSDCLQKQKIRLCEAVKLVGVVEAEVGSVVESVVGKIGSVSEESDESLEKVAESLELDCWDF